MGITPMLNKRQSKTSGVTHNMYQFLSEETHPYIVKTVEQLRVHVQVVEDAESLCKRGVLRVHREIMVFRECNPILRMNIRAFQIGMKDVREAVHIWFTRPQSHVENRDALSEL